MNYTDFAREDACLCFMHGNHALTISDAKAIVIASFLVNSFRYLLPEYRERLTDFVVGVTSSCIIFVREEDVFDRVKVISASIR